jgi:excinuclease ABC subunit C
LHLVQTIRDEAHRFAVSFHRNRRNTNRMKSELHEVKGIGPKTVEKLLRHFGSLERVRLASEAELEIAVGVTASKRVKAHLGESLESIPLVQIDVSLGESLAVEETETEHVGESG